MMPEKFQEFLNFVRPTDHSKYSPSSADRWLETGCSGSLQMCKGIPNETSKYAEEGTLAHEYCEHVVRERMFMIPIPNGISLRLSQLKDGGDEMVACAEQYADVIEWWLKNPDLGDIIWWGLEKGVPVFPELGCFGTGDCIVVGTKGAAVIDFKYGKGKNVAANTVQLQVYAAGLAKHIPVPEGKDYNITAVVHQPRINDEAKEHTYKYKELIDFLEVIERSIHKCEKPDAPLNDGSHCFWCPARRTNDPNKKCPIIANRAVKLAAENFDKFLSETNTAPKQGDVALKAKRDQAMVKLLTLYPAIKDTVESAKDELKERLLQGEHIEGLKISEKIGSRKVTGANLDEKVQIIKQHFPELDPIEHVPAKTKLKTLSAMEKEVGKGKLNPVCTQPITKTVEVIDSKTKEILSSMSQYAKQIGGF